jgi:hypothetical protein
MESERLHTMVEAGTEELATHVLAIMGRLPLSLLWCMPQLLPSLPDAVVLPPSRAATVLYYGTPAYNDIPYWTLSLLR